VKTCLTVSADGVLHLLPSDTVPREPERDVRELREGRARGECGSAWVSRCEVARIYVYGIRPRARAREAERDVRELRVRQSQLRQRTAITVASLGTHHARKNSNRLTRAPRDARTHHRISCTQYEIACS